MEPVWLETVNNTGKTVNNRVCLGQYSAKAITSMQTAAGYAHDHSADA